MPEAIRSLTVNTWIVIIITALLGAWMPQHIDVTLTPSIKYRVFWVKGKPSANEPLKGKYIMFDEPDNPYLPHPKTRCTTKKVVCAGGDHLDVEGDNFICNGRLLGIGKHYTLKGQPVKLFAFNGVIPDGSLFVMGDHADSFDSRYHGFISINGVKAVEVPIF